MRRYVRGRRGDSMQMRTFWVLNVALAVGCGGSEYSDYFLPTGASRSTSSTTSGTGGTNESTSMGAGGNSSGSGTSGSNTTGGSSGTGSGSSGTGNGSSGSSAAGGSGGSTGSGSGGSGNTVDAGATGCRSASAWMLGQPYAAGATVRGVCMNPGGGSTVCDVGKTYLWACKEGAACSVYAPGADGWWGAWTVGMRCD